MAPPLARLDWGGPGGGGPRIVLLHGFAGAAAQWAPVAGALASAGARVTAFDLPGHGASLHLGAAGAKACADAVLASLAGDGPCHIAGHSFGGAVAALCVLMQPDRFGGATLVSPGGFGPAINAAAMRALAEADGPDEVRAAFAPFHAPGFAVPDPVVQAAVAARRQPGAREALRRLLGIILKDDGTQGVLPLARLAAGPVPLTLVWGAEDAILPASQAGACPAARRLVLQGVGHMPHDEAPAALAEAVGRAAGLRPRPA